MKELYYRKMIEAEKEGDLFLANYMERLYKEENIKPKSVLFQHRKINRLGLIVLN